MKRQPRLLTFAVAIGFSMLFIALLFHMDMIRWRKLSGQFLLWRNTKVSEIYIPARYIWATLSFDKRWLFSTTGSIGCPDLFKLIPPFRTIKREHFIEMPFDFYIWNFFWVGEWLVVQGLRGDPFIIDYELNGFFSKWGKYQNAAEVIVWSERLRGIREPFLPLGFGDGWKRVLERTSLYASFVPCPDGRTMAVLTSREEEREYKDIRGFLYKGFLYSLPDGKRLRGVKWRGAVIEGPYFSTSNYRRILVWVKDGKIAWSVSEEIMKPYQPGNHILITVDFEGRLRKLNGKHKREWLYSNTVYAQPAPDRIAVIITKMLGRNNSSKGIWLAHYSPTKKLWETQIPINTEYSEIVAITPDGKGIILQDKVDKEIETKVRVWIYKVESKKLSLITQIPPINRVVDWLDNNHLLVIVGNKKERFMGVIKLQ